MSNLSNVNKCGLNEVIIFLLAIIFGTACSICSKTMMSMTGTIPVPASADADEDVGGDGEKEVVMTISFQKPLFQTFGMFVGMLFGLVMHWVVLIFRIPFPGYDFGNNDNDIVVSSDVELRSEKTALLGSGGSSGPVGNDNNGAMAGESTKTIPVWMYFFLAIPAIFDLAATALCMMGLQYLDVSIYQMLRGSGIIFVALMKQHVLKEHLHKFHWVGVFWNVVSVLIVGSTALLVSSASAGGGSNDNVTASQTLLGVCLMMVGAFVQSVQFVFEEHVMKMDVPAPPLLLIGMEGFWGTLLSVCVMYPIGYYMPGDDNGSFEDPFNTWEMFVHSKNIQVAFVIYFFVIFFYNLFAVLVTFMLSAIWHAILDNFRPITIWATDLIIFYYINPLFGETWTQYSYIQVAGMAVLLYGTAIYNAPNDGSLLLEGQWWALGIDLSKEYDEIRREREAAEIDAEWEAKRQAFKMRTYSSFIESPRISVHTQALRGIGAQHN